MKRAILAMLFIVGVAFVAKAQQPPPHIPAHPSIKTPQQRAMGMTRTLQSKLNLTGKQTKQVDKIFYNQALEMDSIRNYPSQDRRADQQQKRMIRINTNQEIMGVLNTDQQQEFILYQKMVKQKRMNKKGGNAAPASAPDDDTDNQG